MSYLALNGTSKICYFTDWALSKPAIRKRIRKLVRHSPIRPVDKKGLKDIVISAYEGKGDLTGKPRTNSARTWLLHSTLLLH